MIDELKRSKPCIKDSPKTTKRLRQAASSYKFYQTKEGVPGTCNIKRSSYAATIIQYLHPRAGGQTRRLRLEVRPGGYSWRSDPKAIAGRQFQKPHSEKRRMKGGRRSSTYELRHRVVVSNDEPKPQTPATHGVISPETSSAPKWARRQCSQQRRRSQTQEG